MANPNPGFDVFLSHNSADKPSVEELARRLLDAGIQPWLDSWNLVPGDPWQEGLEEALDTCTSCAVFLGPSGVGPWHNEELRVALDRRARDRTRQFRVIPVLLPGADPADPNTLPRFLSRMVWVDFRSSLDDANAFHRLLSGIRGQAPGPQPSTTPSPASSVLSAYLLPSAALTPNQRQRLEAELTRLQGQYDTWTRRIYALDTDIGRALDTLQKQVLEERRAELVAERQRITDQMDNIDEQLAVKRIASPYMQPAEVHVAPGSDTHAGVRLTVHLAYFVIDKTPAVFINATNLSDRVVVISHVWIDYQPQIPVLQPDRLPPVTMEPYHSWETWVELSQLPADIGQDIFQRARVRLTTGEVVTSQKNEGVPDFGIVPGGPIRYRPVKRQAE